MNAQNNICFRFFSSSSRDFKTNVWLDEAYPLRKYAWFSKIVLLLFRKSVRRMFKIAANSFPSQISIAMGQKFCTCFESPLFFYSGRIVASYHAFGMMPESKTILNNFSYIVGTNSLSVLCIRLIFCPPP